MMKMRSPTVREKKKMSRKELTIIETTLEIKNKIRRFDWFPNLFSNGRFEIF